MTRNEPRRSSFAAEPPILSTPASLKLPRPGIQSPSRKPSFLQQRILVKKEQTDKLERHSKKYGSNDRQLEAVLDEISDFNSEAIESFNPSYVEFDQRLANALDTIQGQVERLQAMREHSKELTKNFETRISETKVTFENELDDLHKWQAPKEKLEGMQERVIELKEILNSSKTKLAKIDDELKVKEERTLKDRQQFRTTTTSTQLVLAVVILIASYYLFLR